MLKTLLLGLTGMLVCGVLWADVILPPDSAGVALDSTSAAAADTTALATAMVDTTALATAAGLPRRHTPMVLVSRGDLVVDGLARGELVEPAGLAVDAFGRLYVADAALHRLVRYDARGVRLGEAGALGSAEGDLRRPGSVALLGTLSLAVLDIENRRILVYDLDGRLQGTLVDFDDPVLVQSLGRIEPRALAADRGGALMVVDVERDRLLAFDFSGRFVRTLGGFGAAPGAFRGLSAVAVSRRGELVTFERVTRRVQRLDAGGVLLGAFSLPGPADRGAVSLAVDDSARVALADAGHGVVSVWDAAGRLLAAAGGFDRPTAIAFAPGGTLVITEAGSGRIRRFAIQPRVRPDE